jgi:membrane-associated phospholipid phosphatase
MNDSQRNACWLAAASLGTAAAFTVLTVAVVRGETADWDQRSKRTVKARTSEPQRRLSQTSAPVGKWWSQVVASLVGAGRLTLSGRRAAAGAVAGASIGAAVLTPLLERVIPIRRPPPEHPEYDNPSKQSYPSGHALRTSATATTTAYVLWREGRAPWAGGPLALASVVSSGGKLVLSRHWTTDIIGGYLAGIAWGTACASLYELARDS